LVCESFEKPEIITNAITRRICNVFIAEDFS
jgi:hypothetical protein